MIIWSLNMLKLILIWDRDDILTIETFFNSFQLLILILIPIYCSWLVGISHLTLSRGKLNWDWTQDWHHQYILHAETRFQLLIKRAAKHMTIKQKITDPVQGDIQWRLFLCKHFKFWNLGSLSLQVDAKLNPAMICINYRYSLSWNILYFHLAILQISL